MNIETLCIYKVLIPGCTIFLVHDPDVSDFSLNIIKNADVPATFMPYTNVFGPLTFKPDARVSTLELLVLSGITEEQLCQEYQKHLTNSYRPHSEDLEV